MIFCRILDHIEESKKAKQLDMEEGENIKKQVDMYMGAKQAIEEQRRKVMVKTFSGADPGFFFRRCAPLRNGVTDW